MEIVIYCPMTSRDAQEIADRLRDIELNAKCGDSVTARDWIVDSPDGMHVKVRIMVDQDRARKHGLMR